MKKAMKVIGIIVLVIAALIAVLWVKNLIDANKPYVSDTYYAESSFRQRFERQDR